MAKIITQPGDYRRPPRTLFVMGKPPSTGRAMLGLLVVKRCPTKISHIWTHRQTILCFCVRSSQCLLLRSGLRLRLETSVVEARWELREGTKGAPNALRNRPFSKMTAENWAEYQHLKDHLLFGNRTSFVRLSSTWVEKTEVENCKI